MAPRLKLFRMPIGFHDAYVAASSQKAALEAWGADADLFARGMAERVENPQLLAEASDKPGTVIKRARGTALEHLASARDPGARPPGRGRTGAKAPRARPRPRPSRKALDRAEQKLEEHRHGVEARVEDLEAERARIGALIVQTRERGEGEAARLQAAIDRARAKYEEALDRWRGEDG
ncbi:hypothetical protein [Sphingobium sp. Sx8-8]|uniref:hypothetical protein n=1 Tax=Sphingobium sp. Sx8-8 TaxID=2933617 RepID=UPI001F575E71|nr:hypothetical protein [Sphingobium sp. Sx8-8]